MLNHLAEHGDGVAHAGRRLHVEFHMQEGEAGILHRRQHQPLTEGIDQRPRHHALRQRHLAAMGGVGEQLLGQPGHVAEIDQVGLGQRAAGGAEPHALVQILEMKADPDFRDVIVPVAHGSSPWMFCGAFLVARNGKGRNRISPVSS